MKHNWRKTSARLYIGCVAAALFKSGHRNFDAFIEKVNNIIPNWKNEFATDGEITDYMLWQRADKAIRYESEQPWRNPLKMPFWKQAQHDVKNMKSTFDFKNNCAKQPAVIPPTSKKTSPTAAAVCPHCGLKIVLGFDRERKTRKVAGR